MLVLKNLSVMIEKKKIIDDLTLTFAPGKIYAIMGTNGSGKSTLAKTLMGDPRYMIASGSIMIDDAVITDLPPHERAQRGIFLAPQSPLAIPGVTVQQLLRAAIPREKCDSTTLLQKIIATAKELYIPDELLKRSLNENFSGGERKKMEMLQMAILDPQYIILDEIDTGVDVDALKIIASFLAQTIARDPQKTVIIITHYNRILSYLPVDHVLIMQDGRIIQTGDATLAQEIEDKGYKS